MGENNGRRSVLGAFGDAEEPDAADDARDSTEDHPGLGKGQTAGQCDKAIK